MNSSPRLFIQNKAAAMEFDIMGFSTHQGFERVIDSISKCIPVAEKCGVVPGLENHWGLGRTADGMLRIVEV